MRIEDEMTDDVAADILAAAEAAGSREMCGLLVWNLPGLAFVRCENVASDDVGCFEIAPDDWLAAEKLGFVAAVVHSHAATYRFLSGADRQMQLITGLPWVLACGGAVYVYQPVPHLRGRQFVYGQLDCFALLRDAYHLAGINLDDVPRRSLEADAGSGVFEHYAPRLGFDQVVGEPQAGDVLLTGRNGRADHVCLYLGDGVVLHHAAGQLSGRVGLSDALRRQVVSQWRHQLWQPEMMAALNADLLHGGWEDD